MKTSALSASIITVLLTLASAPAHAFTMTFDENGGCSITTGTCSGSLAAAPSTALVPQGTDVLTFALPSKVFTGEAIIYEPDGVTSNHPPAKPGAFASEPLKAAIGALRDPMI